MNIVVLDGYTLNPGDLDWEPLRRLGTTTQIYDRTAPGELLDRAADAELLLTNKTVLAAETLALLPKLRYIGVLATGYNVVDVAAAEARGITVTNVPTYGTHSVAQFVFSLLLELCHRVQRHSDAVHAGEWSQSVDFCFTRAPLMELAGRTMGLVGLGRIGTQTAKIAEAMGMKVIASGRASSLSKSTDGIKRVPLEELLRSADVVSLHCPLTPSTANLINEDALRMMKPIAFLINTSRGPLIDEQALAAALHEGRLAGAALDVLSVEPPPADHPLLGAPNCIITPHIAWATFEARQRLLGTVIDNVKAYLEGRPQNTVGATK
ncbi:NAD(P)-dependent oxidoreductase [Paenibacillus turpanensis]|uniref:NAD(P)-dependent oxidoreductase n=1 Tax=Paenibacillus turpanensis TaxID=2689078 RepID=UPI0014080921